MINDWLGHRFLTARLIMVFAFGFAIAQGGSALAQTPTINLLLPSSATAGGEGFVLTVSGAGFVTDSKVFWNKAQKTTLFFSSSTLEAQITADDISTAGNVDVTVVNPGPVTSVPAVFHVIGAQMTITGINPATVTAGGDAFTLTVSGTGFTSTSQVFWDDEVRPTTFVNNTTLTAAIPASDIATAGSVSIKVVDGSPGGATSNEVTISIVSSGLYFPQIVAGGGYSTVFTIFNTSAQTVLCNLSLTDQAGNPFTADLASLAAGNLSPGEGDRFETVNSFLAFYLQPGAMRIITMNSATPGSPAKSGWAKVDISGGRVYGVATYKRTSSGILTTSAGVLSTHPVSYATIPVDNDAGQNRYTGFAIANPGGSDVNIRLITIDQGGVVTDNILPPQLNPIGPGEQVAVFLHEALPSRADFKGTVILYVLGDQQVAMTALVQEQGIFSAIPVVADKVANVP